jgi:hypothetical protein
VAGAGEDACVVHQLDGPHDQDRADEHREQHLGGCRLGQAERNQPQRQGHRSQHGGEQDRRDQVLEPQFHGVAPPFIDSPSLGGGRPGKMGHWTREPQELPRYEQVPGPQDQTREGRDRHAHGRQVEPEADQVPDASEVAAANWSLSANISRAGWR